MPLRGLLRRVEQPGPLDVYFPTDDQKNVPEAERIFFAGLQLSNGTFKTTGEGRLDDVNELVAHLLPRNRHLVIMDVAASSGVTTAEWSEQLNAMGIDHEVIATDYAVNGILLTIGRRGAVLWQENGHPLAIQLRNHCVYLRRSGRIKFATACLRPPLRGLYRLVVRQTMSPYEAPPAPRSPRARPVGLVSRRLTSNSAVRMVHDDITQPGRFAGQIDVCRATNVLNRSYFSDDVIEMTARILLSRLRDGGLLILGRTHDENDGKYTEATVFRTHEGALEVVGQLNGGSEIENLALAASRRHV
jgi:hypothetical protein